MFNTAILFIIFNRPDTTEQVFNEIRKIKPTRFYVAADGARKNVVGEDKIVEQTRNIIDKIDWECELKTLYRDDNLGCKIAPSSAIDWFFEQEDEGIILEDDCLPNLSFFNFCEQMLQKYRYDDRIWHISGVNFQKETNCGDDSYYFSRYCLIWGWASWKRAWQHYDVTIKSFPKFVEDRCISQLFKKRQLQKHWLEQFRQVYENQLDAWDHQWSYTLFTHHALSIIPKVNLISNIGFGSGATHTLDTGSQFANMKQGELKNLKHPEFIIRNQDADDFSSKYVVLPPLKQRVIMKLASFSLIRKIARFFR